MQNCKRSAAALLLAVVLVLTLPVQTAAAVQEDRLDRSARLAVNWLLDRVEPRYGSIGGEWAVVAAAQSGTPMDSPWYADYLHDLEQTVRESRGMLDARKYTEYSRVILSLSALGLDARNAWGFDLTTPLGDFDQTVWQGPNGPAWALIALNSRNYPMPAAPKGKRQASRSAYVDRLLSQQLPDGGWSLTGKGSADPDLTAMALQALSGCRSGRAVELSIERGLSCLAEQQTANGGFGSWGAENAESSAQVLIALSALGVQIDDARFVKNGRTPLDALLAYQLPDGSFRHVSGGPVSLMATEQAACALTAVCRTKMNMSELYAMEGSRYPAIHPVPVSRPAVRFPDTVGHQEETAILALSARGILNGRNDGCFHPEDPMTRAEFAAVVVRALGLPVGGRNPFRDVAENDWFAPAAGAASRHGIVRGRTTDHFDPRGTITRQEAAVMAVRGAWLCGEDTAVPPERLHTALDGFSDVSGTEWSAPALAYCAENAMLTGRRGVLRPADRITRGEAARLLWQLLIRADLA